MLGEGVNYNLTYLKGLYDCFTYKNGVYSAKPDKLTEVYEKFYLAQLIEVWAEFGITESEVSAMLDSAGIIGLSGLSVSVRDGVLCGMDMNLQVKDGSMRLFVTYTFGGQLVTLPESLP